MRTTLGIAIISGLFLSGIQNWAVADMKLGLYDLPKVLKDSEPAKKAQEQFNKDATAKQKEFDSEKMALAKASEEFKKQSVAMSEKKRTEKEQELQQKFFKLQQMGAQFDGMFKQKQEEMLAKIVESANKAAEKVGKQKGYTHIARKEVFALSPEIDDITDEVIAILNKDSK